MLINPGFTATAFEQNLVVDTAIYKTAHRRSMLAKDVAEATVRAMKRGRSEITLSAQGRLLLLVNRALPRFVDWGLARWTRRLYNDNAALLNTESRNGPTPAPSAPPCPPGPSTEVLSRRSP